MTVDQIDWDEPGTLRRVLASGYTYDVRSDPLWVLIYSATQGHEGPVGEMQIEMVGGTNYQGEDIERLARRPDRKTLPVG